MINVSNATKRYGDRVLYQGASFLVRQGDKIGLVGPNGAGKSTIFKVIVGDEHLDDGTVTVDPGVLVGYFDQNIGEMAGRSALAECMAGAGKVSEIGLELAKMEERMGRFGEEPMEDDEMMKFMERFGELQMEFQSRGGYDLESRAQAILTGLGIGPDTYNHPVESFSGGWKMRIALGQILLLNPDVLLIDEPTNHLDIEAIIWLEEWLKGFKGAVVMTSHDREFMNRICGRTVEIANKQITTYSGNYDFYVKDREIRREQQIAAFKRQQDQLAKEEDFIAKFAARASHAAQVQSRVKKLDKIERLDMPPETKKLSFDFAPAPRSGNDVVKLESVAKEYPLPEGGVKKVFSGISGMVMRQNKIAITGVNGAGKSTLLKCVTGDVKETSGKATLGASVNMGYFSQYSCDLLSPENTVWDEVSNRLPAASIGYLRNLLGTFMFSGDDIEKKIRMLSGGEKSRVMLACILATPVNFEGTVMIVSHDRYFLKSIVNRVFEIDHGEMRIYEGNYDYYLEKTAHKHHH